jgi:SAM-dependent methyltransferase
MAHTQFLHVLRKAELQEALKHFPNATTAKPLRVLEIGAGTGYQAKFLAEKNFDVLAIDLASSAYRKERVHPVTEYDGHNIPAAANSMDVVFSSNVLEHVGHIDEFLREARRVTAIDGVNVHVLPTSSWRFWTILGHYGWLAKRLWRLGRSRVEAPNADADIPQVPNSWRERVGIFVPLRHGERGVTLTEMYFYTKRWWTRTFERAGFDVVATYPAGLFYTGGFVFGGKMSLSRRRKLARILGSSCRVYVLKARRELTP